MPASMQPSTDRGCILIWLAFHVWLLKVACARRLCSFEALHSVAPGAACSQAMPVAWLGRRGSRCGVSANPSATMVQITYIAPMSGEYKVTLAVGTVTVAGSPFRVPCQQPRPSEHETTVDLRNGHGFVGEPYSAVVTVRDQFGQPCVRHGSCSTASAASKPCCLTRRPSAAKAAISAA